MAESGRRMSRTRPASLEASRQAANGKRAMRSPSEARDSGTRQRPERRRSRPTTVSALNGRSRPSNATRTRSNSASARPNRRDRRRRERTPAKPRSLGVMAFIYFLRMVIVSIGIGVLVGTMLSIWDPSSRPLVSANQDNPPAAETAAQENQGAAADALAPVELGQEIPALKTAVEQMIAQTAPKEWQMTPTVFLLDLDSNDFVSLGGDAVMSAASTIKFPILVAFFQDVDAGKIRLDETIVLKKEHIGGGSGDLQFQPVGTKYSLLDVATKMMTISDNTATNMVIDRLGGKAALNERLKSWGMGVTVINNPLPDLEGTNQTSAQDLALLMARISRGELVSLRSRDRMLDIMQDTTNNGMLPQGLDGNAAISHKTGDIGTAIGDVGVIDAPNGKRYVAAVIVKRQHNDDRAYTLVGKISEATYKYFLNPQPAASPAAQPASPPNQAANAETASSPR